MAKALIHLILRTGINEKSENRDERKFSMNQKLKEKILVLVKNIKIQNSSLALEIKC